MQLRRLFQGLALAACLAFPASAQEVDRIGAHAGWGVFEDGVGADRLCWVAASAELGALPLGGDEIPPAKILVLFTSGKDEVSLELRGGLSGAKAGEFSIGDTVFPLFFQDGWGWLSGRNKEQAFKAAMQSHKTAYIRIGETGYSLSLVGFSPALRDAEDACTG